MGVEPVYKMFEHDGVRCPNMATVRSPPAQPAPAVKSAQAQVSELFLAQVFSDRGGGVRAPVVFYNRSNEAAQQLKAGDFDWAKIFEGGASPHRRVSALPAARLIRARCGWQAAAGSTAVVSSLPSRPRRLTSSLRA